MNEQKNTTVQPKGRTCGCGRSPTGYCIGWHSLSVKDFEERLELYKQGKVDLAGKPL